MKRKGPQFWYAAPQKLGYRSLFVARALRGRLEVRREAEEEWR
jgi:hypothetical protein